MPNAIKPMPTNDKPKADLINQTRAAAIIGVARQSIAGMIARGELESETVAGLVFVKRESAERVAEQRAARPSAA